MGFESLINCGLKIPRIFFIRKEGYKYEIEKEKNQ